MNEEAPQKRVFEQTTIENMAKEIAAGQKKTLKILMLLFGTIIFFSVLIFSPKHNAILLEKLIMMVALTILCLSRLSMIYPHNNESQK